LLEHDPEKPAAGLDAAADTGFPKKVMLQEKLKGKPQEKTDRDAIQADWITVREDASCGFDRTRRVAQSVSRGLEVQPECHRS